MPAANLAVVPISPDMSFSDHYYWGPLVNPDKSPAPLLEQLCLGIAQLMITFHDCGTTDLTPERLAAFYLKVGGNYDTLFLETKPSALSFIYQSLGCFHSLQPSNDPFERPTLPALLPSGFVRWQTIQILLDPDEHSEYLQAAVRLWDVRNPRGGFFPKSIPRDAFPSEPDPEMVAWHEEVSQRLEYDYLKRNTPRSSPPNFGPYQYHYLPKHSLPKEDKRVSRSRRGTAPYRYVEPSDPPPRVKHRRGSSADHPRFSSRKAQSGFPAQLDEEPAKSRPGRSSSFAHPSGSPTVPGFYPDSSSEDSPSPEPEPPRTHRRRNLSVPRTSRARPHSHEAYARKPPRDISPDYHKRYSHHDDHGINSSKVYYSERPHRARSWVYKEDLPHPRQSGIKFREYIFDEPPSVSSSPEAPVYHFHPKYVNATNPSYTSRSRANLDSSVEEERRRSPSGGFPDRSRPFAPMWGAPVQSSKKYIPVAMPDVEYTSSKRRVYDR